MTITFDPIARLDKETRELAAGMDRAGIRGLVEFYYQLQEHRIALDAQVRELEAAEKPAGLTSHFATEIGRLERQMPPVLQRWVEARKPGEWLLSIFGIGPVISAGLLAHIDITRAPTVGHIWAFAGLDPTKKWGKGEKRPHNAVLKTLCWKASDSFVKFRGDERCYYGHLYAEKKAKIIARNEGGEFAELAKATLEQRNIKDKELLATYEAGKIPPGRVDLQARRWTVKLLLAHLHAELYRDHFKQEPPLPYPIAFLDHAHVIAPPAS